MRPDDLASALSFSTAAGWNSTVDDWRMLLHLAPDGCFGIEADGQLVATTTVIRYGQTLAWIGMVLTKAEYRRRGFARRLMAHALEYCDSSRIETVKLDATDQGRRLYESMGFRPEQPIERWAKGAGSVPTFGHASEFSGRFRDLDLRAFGADRWPILTRLANRSKVYEGSDAYLLMRAGRAAGYVGPCIAAEPAAARAVLMEALSKNSDDDCYWDLLPANREATALASELRFSRQRVL